MCRPNQRRFADLRLGRDLAVKLLPSEVSSFTERLARLVAVRIGHTERKPRRRCTGASLYLMLHSSK